MKKFAKIDVSDNWADEMDIEYMTFMPMTEWKKLEAKLMKCDAPVEIGIGTNESVWYENGEDYLGHCAVTEVDSDGEGHGNDSLDPMNVYEWLLDAKKCAKARGVENAKAEAFLKRLYRDIVKDYDANRQTRYVVHMTCSNSPRGYFSGVMSKNFNKNDKPFTFKTEVKEVHFIEKDGAMQTLNDRVRIPDDAMDEGIRGCVDSWRKQHYGDWKLKEFHSQTMTDNMFMRKIDGVEELAMDFMGNPRTIVNNGNATLRLSMRNARCLWRKTAFVVN